LRTIHRYVLPITDRPVINMPVDARVLFAPPSERVDMGIEIWAEVSVDAAMAPRAFRVVGTGNPLPGDCERFIGTVINDGGRFVWHVYEAQQAKEDQ
jgi:hypothetical protein